jgi:hypothetical protein
VKRAAAGCAHCGHLGVLPPGTHAMERRRVAPDFRQLTPQNDAVLGVAPDVRLLAPLPPAVGWKGPQVHCGAAGGGRRGRGHGVVRLMA